MDKASWPPCDTNFDNAGPALPGFNRPTRYEGKVSNLEVYGTVPPSISGTFYRIMPEPYHVPFVKNDITSGKYRNPFTDLVKFADRTTANTTAFPFKGVILALKEDSQPYAVDPRTLETIGRWDFDGQLESETFTAHPKYDVKTREVLSFGYEGKGIGTRDVFYMSIDEHGKFNEKVWFQAPFCGFQHEMAFTDNWWFQGPNLFTGHVANAWEENGQLHLHVSMVRGNGFGFFPEQNGEATAFDLEVLAPHVCEFVLDPHSTKLVYQSPTEVVTAGPNEFPRIDDRVFGKKHRFIYGNMIDMSPGVTDWEYSTPLADDGIGHMNVLYKYDLVTGATQKYIRGPRHFFQEPQFVPRHPGAAEGGGFLIALVNNFNEMTSELVIIDCDDFEKHAVIAKLPVRLRPGFHGNWVDDTDIDGRPNTVAEFAIPHRRDENNETNETDGQ
ncbi:hypothetical protein COL26b_013888 [Colletotrichum chrysophilum]|uniref:uncharacterized protein n=1 Tax=Colletotrichum chrysophilum TaxID=1836956 RepID=UPI002300B55E|nr:uncharacterized protein COL26b_013888 [Colletotrichum chrysophilum]KAJ0361019.1 hypothetical protein COL26b_013888 [Colletotrichum chrysophilum]